MPSPVRGTASSSAALSAVEVIETCVTIRDGGGSANGDDSEGVGRGGYTAPNRVHDAASAAVAPRTANGMASRARMAVFLARPGSEVAAGLFTE